METPLAVVVTNKGATWKKVLNCYGVGREDVLRQLHSALSKVKQQSRSSDVNAPYHVEHISLPSLDRMATRISLGDGFLYFFSCESNVFVLEELVPHLAGVRCSSKSAGLTVEDVIKDSEKVVSLVETILMPYLVHYSPKLVDPHYLSSTRGKKEHKKTLDLTQAFPLETNLAQLHDDVAPGRSDPTNLQLQYNYNNNNKEENLQPSESNLSGLHITDDGDGLGAPPPRREDGQDTGTSSSLPPPTATTFTSEENPEKRSALVALAQTNLGVEANPLRGDMQLNNSIPESVFKPALDMPEIAAGPSSSLELDPMKEKGENTTELFLETEPSENLPIEDASAPAAVEVTSGPLSPPVTAGGDDVAVVEKIRAPKTAVNFSPSCGVGAAKTTAVDSPLSMIQNMFQAAGTEVRATTRIKEDIAIKVKGGCVTHARCSGSVNMQCQENKEADGEERVSLQLHPLWLRQLNSLHVTSGSEFVQNLTLDCGSCTKFRVEGEVVKYSVRPREYLYPLRSFFQAQVCPRSVTLLVHVLASPKLTSIHTGRCSVEIHLNECFQRLQLKDSTPKVNLDSGGLHLVWNDTEVLGGNSREGGVAFKAVFTKAGGGLVETEDLMKVSQVQARITSSFNYLPFVRQNCQVLKQLEMAIDALPSTFVST